MRLASQYVFIVAVLAAVVGAALLVGSQTSSGGRVGIVLPTANAHPEADLKVYISGAV